MNTEYIVHPKLHHYGLTTPNLDAMIDWYRKVLGMTPNYRTAGGLAASPNWQGAGGRPANQNWQGAPAPASAPNWPGAGGSAEGRQNRPGPPFEAAWISNDEVNHRLALFEMPGVVVDPDKPRHVRLQHVAFEYPSLDDLLGTYVRLKSLGIMPGLAADQGLQTAIYYKDPDDNNVELNVNNYGYGNEWTATEHIKNAPATWVQIDPDKLVAAYLAGATSWQIHQRAAAGEFAPENPADARAFL